MTQHYKRIDNLRGQKAYYKLDNGIWYFHNTYGDWVRCTSTHRSNIREWLENGELHLLDE